MFDYKKFFEGSIKKLHEEKRYRLFRDIARQRGSFPKADLKTSDKLQDITVWCSNDYLGMGQHPHVLKAINEAVDKFGAGAGGTRNISGTHRLIVELEEELADLHHKEAALLFTSGYIANETSLSTLGAMIPGCIIFSDSDNHASMIEGIRHSRAEKHIFKHNDPSHLEELLKSAPTNTPKLVAFEALYSMDGDRAPLKELIEVSKRYGAFIFVDETHSVALYGPRGGGLLEAEGLLDHVDIIQGGLGKGFGVVGGFITASRTIVDFIRSNGSGFIFTTALPPMVAAAAKASIRHLKDSQIERLALFDTVLTVQEGMLERSLPILKTDTHIVPFMVRDSKLCQEIADTLLFDFGIYIQPINYPTVPRGGERLRITPTPLHTPEMINELITALDQVWSRYSDKSYISQEERAYVRL